MLQKIIATIIGIIMAAVSITGCYVWEDQTNESEEKKQNFTYTRLMTQNGEEYETKFIFVPIGTERTLDRNEIEDVQSYFLGKGYTVSQIMWTADWTQAEMTVYSMDDFVDYK